MPDLRETLDRELAELPIRPVEIGSIEARARRRGQRRRAGTVALVAVLTFGSLAFLREAFEGQAPAPIEPGPSDEGWIVFGTVPWPDQPARIYRMRPDGSQLTPITDGLVGSYSPAVSPDGSTVVFVRVDEGQGRSSTTEGVYAMDAAGGDVRELLRTGEPTPVSVRGLAWSPDGSRIGFVRGIDEAMNELWVMNADGSEPHRVGDLPVASFSWSPDGSRLVVAGTSLDHDRYRSDLFVMDADGTGVERLTDDGGSWAPAWSPDGISIAFRRWVGEGKGAVGVLTLDDPSEVTSVWRGGAFDSIAWSPDGSSLLIDPLRDDGACLIVSVGSDGSASTEVLVSERPTPFGDAETSLCAGSLTWAPAFGLDPAP
jgi:dipeptidyl aminopeptidase/acylaminoacyl peptidase